MEIETTTVEANVGSTEVKNHIELNYLGISNLKILIISVLYVQNEIPYRLLDMSRLTKLEVLQFYEPPYLEDPLKSVVFPT